MTIKATRGPEIALVELFGPWACIVDTTTLEATPVYYHGAMKFGYWTAGDGEIPEHLRQSVLAAAGRFDGWTDEMMLAEMRRG